MTSMPEQPVVRTVARSTPSSPRHSEPAVIRRKDGALFVVWQEFLRGGPKCGEDNSPARLSSMISTDGGFSWIRKRTLVEPMPNDVNVYSPNLLLLPSGRLLFIFMRYHVLEQGKPPETSACLMFSDDEGQTFGPEHAIWRRDPITFSSGSVKRMNCGRIILPVTRQTGAVWCATDHLVGGVMLSDDNGETWRESMNWIDLPLRGVMETHVEELMDGRVMMIMRTQLGSVFASVSEDGGESWSKPQTTGLRSPESCPELARLKKSGLLIIVWNNSEYDPSFYSHYGKRSPLTVALSRDEGLSWSRPLDIETDPCRAFSNPVCFPMADGRVILLYWTCPYDRQTWRLRTDAIDLRIALFDEKWLLASVGFCQRARAATNPKNVCRR